MRSLALAVLAASMALSAGAQQSPLYGQVVESIDFRPDVDSLVDDLAAAVAIQVGEPLSVQGLQDSIKAIYGLGRFRDVRADVRPREGSGVDVIFRVYLQRRVGSIAWQLDGVAPSGFRMQREVDLVTGDYLSLSAVDRAAVRTRRQYVREGFLEAVVDPEISFDSETGRASVLFHVTPGPRAEVGAVIFAGDVGSYTSAELLDQIRSQPGEWYDVDEAREDEDRLREYLFSEGRRLARVSLEQTEYEPETTSVDLTFEVAIGPEVEVMVEGVPEDDVRRIVRFDRKEGYSLDKVDSTVDALIDRYQSRGHYFVTVDAEEVQTETGPYRIIYRVEPGPQYRLGEIGFEGNETFTDEELRGVIATSRPGAVAKIIAAVTRRSTGVTSDQLEEDQDALEAWYRLEGFIDPDIGSARVSANESEGTIDVMFPIREGQRIIVSEVIVDGVDEVSGEPPELMMTADSPLNPQRIAQDVVTLQQHYASKGYFEVRVRASLPDEVTGDDPLTYTVDPGERITVGSVTVSGNSYTDTQLILDKARIRQGSPLTWSGLVQARQRLYGLGIFTVVEILPTPSVSSTSVRDIEIRVQEGKFLTVSGALGYSTEDEARGTASVSHRNLFGEARYLGLEATLSQRVNRGVATYREPLLFGYDLPTQVSIFRRDELRADEKAELESLGTSVEMTRIVRGQARWGLRYEYRINECVDGELCELAREGVPIVGLEPENQEIQISSLTPSFFWDRRNDPVNPSDGFYAGVSLEYAFPLFRAETNFLKGFAQGAVYWEVTEASEIVFSAKLGAIEPLKDDGPGAVVPFAERFLAGGELTHRAFELDRLGVACETLIPLERNLPPGGCEEYLETAEEVELIPLGGNAIALFNLEYRFPIFAALRGALFVDGGNVWSRIDRVDTDEFRWGAGVGLRYLTPVGPLRLDTGFNLDPEPWEDDYEIFLTLGYAF